MLNFIDVSSWQGAIDLAPLPIDGVIAKATEGTDYVNPYCDVVIQQAISQNKCFGFYHFATVGDAAQQAQFFYDNCISYFGVGVPVLDFEGDALSQGGEWAKQFIDKLHELTGNYCMIYCSSGYLETFNGYDVCENCGLWVANYPNVSHPDFSYSGDIEFSISPWAFAAMWQFCSDGRISGFDSDLDLSFFFGDASAWRAYATARQTPSPEPQPSNENIEVLENNDYKITVQKK